MQRVVMLVSCALLLLVSAPRAEEEEYPGQIPNCGSVNGEVQIWQKYTGQRILEGYAETRRQWTGCLSKVRVEAWIGELDGTLGDDESVIGGLYAGFNWVSVPAWRWGNFNAHGKHFYAFGNTRILVDQSVGPGSLVAPQPSDDPPPPEEEDCSAAGTCEDEDFNILTPILLDPEKDGLRLTSSEDGVLFDIDNDGELELVAWTLPGSDDSWLAMDRDGNGQIDDGSELFGNHTPAYFGQETPVARNGFAALDFLQGPDYGTSAADGAIDGSDAAFGRLLLWRDENHNGISEPGELHPAWRAGLMTISLDVKESRKRDPHGNEFRLRAKTEWIADGKPFSSYAYDIFLTISR